MISLPRETVGALMAAGYALVGELVGEQRHEDAWRLSEALKVAESAMLNDDRAEDVGVID